MPTYNCFRTHTRTCLRAACSRHASRELLFLTKVSWPCGWLGPSARPGRPHALPGPWARAIRRTKNCGLLHTPSRLSHPHPPPPVSTHPRKHASSRRLCLYPWTGHSLAGPSARKRFALPCVALSRKPMQRVHAWQLPTAAQPPARPLFGCLKAVRRRARLSASMRASPTTRKPLTASTRGLSQGPVARAGLRAEVPCRRLCPLTSAIRGRQGRPGFGMAVHFAALPLLTPPHLRSQ